MMLLAHAGHWALWLIYLVPVLVVLAASGRALIEQRRQDRDGGAKGEN